VKYWIIALLFSSLATSCAWLAAYINGDFSTITYHDRLTIGIPLSLFLIVFGAIPIKFVLPKVNDKDGGK
jgi:hypothetical protein